MRLNSAERRAKSELGICYGGVDGDGEKDDENVFFAKIIEGALIGTILEHLYELKVHFRRVEKHVYARLIHK